MRINLRNTAQISCCRRHCLSKLGRSLANYFMTKRSLFQAVLLAVCITLPVAGMWFVQKRAGATSQAARSKILGLDFVNYETGQLGADRAVATFTATVEQQSRELGLRHPDTMASRNNLANALIARGNLQEAEAAQRMLLDDMGAVLTPEHPDIFRCRFNLALNLYQQDKIESAREEMEATYEGWRRVLGEGHPRTLAARMMLQSIPSR